MAPKIGDWRDAVIKAFAVLLFFILTGWATWMTTTLLGMSHKLSALDSLSKNWSYTGRNTARIAEFHGVDPNPPRTDGN